MNTMDVTNMCVGDLLELEAQLDNTVRGLGELFYSSRDKYREALKAGNLDFVSKHHDMLLHSECKLKSQAAMLDETLDELRNRYGINMGQAMQ